MTSTNLLSTASPPPQEPYVQVPVVNPANTNEEPPQTEMFFVKKALFEQVEQNKKLCDVIMETQEQLDVAHKMCLENVCNYLEVNNIIMIVKFFSTQHREHQEKKRKKEDEEEEKKRRKVDKEEPKVCNTILPSFL